MTNSLLPPNASQLERDIEKLFTNSLALPVQIKDLWDPFRCPLPLLPWLAWANSVDQWEDSWPEHIKRQVVADAFEVHRYKGTPFAVQHALNSLGIKTNIKEWWETGGSGTPGTMSVLAMLNDNISAEEDGLITASMLKMVTAAIHATKRGSIHFDVELGISFEETFSVAGAFSDAVGLIDLEPESLPVLPDELILQQHISGAEHRVDCIETDLHFSPLAPDPLTLTQSIASACYHIACYDIDLIGAL